METCGDKLNEFSCQCSKGHVGPHDSFTIKAESGEFVHYQWNDKKECFSLSSFEKGKDISIDYLASDEEKEAVVDRLILLAKDNLPKGSVFEIRALCFPNKNIKTIDFGKRKYSYEDDCKNWGICWYYKPAPKEMPEQFEKLGLSQEPLFRNKVENAEDKLGYLLIARLKA